MFNSLQPQALQPARLSMEFSRQEYWSGQPFSSPGDLPNPGIKLRSPPLQVDSLPSEALRKSTKKSLKRGGKRYISEILKITSYICSLSFKRVNRFFTFFSEKSDSNNSLSLSITEKHVCKRHLVFIQYQYQYFQHSINNHSRSFSTDFYFPSVSRIKQLNYFY